MKNINGKMFLANLKIMNSNETHISYEILEVKYEYFKHYFIDYGNF